MARIDVFLTQSAAEEFNSHGNVAVPALDVNADITSHKRTKEAMAYHIVSLNIGLE